ncbi:MAG TPA: cupin domain-containing protein [Gammaproteobacteria bacterium]|nr:cupin domain-containing protein [Gammaproteobacteria bacterium]
MSSAANECKYAERLYEYALLALPASERPEMEEHLAACSECRRELEALRPIVESFAFWPRDVLRPPPGLWDRLAERIAAETGDHPLPRTEAHWQEPHWKQVAPGIECKLLAADEQNDRISMLVRLAPGGAYPPHRHAGVEELHLLHGELMIEDRKLYPGDYNRAEPGTGDKLVWSETGCTCVLITSTLDVLG